MRYVPPILALLVLFALLLLLMRWGWGRRASRQTRAGLPAPAPLTERAAASADADDSATGVYVATTLAEQHLERVTAHGLGARSRVTLARVGSDGADGPAAWLLERQGAPSFTIPDADVVALTTAPGMVGKWIGGDALLVIRWRLGDTLLDTGVRLDARADHDRFLDLAKEHA
ncbi:PH-like domain-containing protein [Brachybacterium huguangmaarense]